MANLVQRSDGFEISDSNFNFRLSGSPENVRLYIDNRSTILCDTRLDHDVFDKLWDAMEIFSADEDEDDFKANFRSSFQELLAAYRAGEPIAKRLEEIERMDSRIMIYFFRHQWETVYLIRAEVGSPLPRLQTYRIAISRRQAMVA